MIYDGSPQSDEALYVATYLSGEWRLPLMVLTVQNDNQDNQNQDNVRGYLETHTIEATYFTESSFDAQTVLTRATELGSDILIMGASDGNPMLGAITGNTVTDFLNSTTIPILICR